MKYSKAIVLQKKIENLRDDLNAAMYEACQYGLFIQAGVENLPFMVGQPGGIALEVRVTVDPTQLEIDI